MFIRQFTRTLCAAAIVCIAFAGAAQAQSAGAMAAARELAELKGSIKLFDPIVVGVIENHRQVLMAGNPGMARDIDAAALTLRNEMQPKRNELQQELIRLYTQFFTEQELKDAVAFYKTPLGKKLLLEEPKVAESSMKVADEWSQKFAEEAMVKMRAELRKKGLNPI
jgi:hypothetical protein